MNSARKEKRKLREVECIVQYHTAKKFQIQDSNLVQSDSKTCAVPARFWSLQLPAPPKCSFRMLEIEKEWWALCFSFLGDCGSLLKPRFLVHRGMGHGLSRFLCLANACISGVVRWQLMAVKYVWSPGRRPELRVLGPGLPGRCGPSQRGALDCILSDQVGVQRRELFFFKGRQQGSKI